MPLSVRWLTDTYCHNETTTNHLGAVAADGIGSS